MDALMTVAGLVMLIAGVLYVVIPPDTRSDKGPLWMRGRIITLCLVAFGCGLLVLLWAIGRRQVG